MSEVPTELFLLVGPSGTGKTSLMNELYKRGMLERVTSHSTRPMREGELQGDPYWFVSQFEFDGLVAEEQFIEQVTYNGYNYGFTHGEVHHALKKGDVGMIVDGHGAKQFIKLFKNRAKVLFLVPPGQEELVRRMRSRGNTQTEIEERLALIPEEMKAFELADWSIATAHPFDTVLESLMWTINCWRHHRQQIWDEALIQLTPPIDP